MSHTQHNHNVEHTRKKHIHTFNTLSCGWKYIKSYVSNVNKNDDLKYINIGINMNITGGNDWGWRAVIR